MKPLSQQNTVHRHTSVTAVSRLLICLFILTTTMAWPSSSEARQLGQQEAEAIAGDFFASRTQGRHKAVARASSVDVRHARSAAATVMSLPAYYICTPEAGEGFVIVAADDVMPPIVGYADKGVFDISRIPQQLADLLEGYEQHAAACIEGRSAKAPKSAGGNHIAPLLTTKWDQGEPYNNLCTSSWGANFWTGCVATAMAQVMKYHNFPAKGNGVTKELWNNPSIDLSQSEYRWDNMRDEYVAGNWTQDEADAVARLMRDIGGAVEMMYGTDASGALKTRIPLALFRNFNYSSDMALLMRESYDTQTWIDIIRENLSKALPVIYGASQMRGGHEFVIDGIDTNDYLHINWGWGGSCDGYYDIEGMTPPVPGAGGGEGRYLRDHSMVVNIFPGDPDADNSDYTSPLMAWDIKAQYDVDADGKLDQSKFWLSFTVSNNTGRDFFGNTFLWHARLLDAERQMIENDFASERFIYAFSHDKYLTTEVMVDFTDMPDGDYLLSLWYSNRDTGEAMEFDFASDEYFPVTVKDGAVYITSAIMPDMPFEILSMRQEGIYDNAANGVVKCMVHNHSNRLLTKTLTIHCVPEDAIPTGEPDVSALPTSGSISVQDLYAGATAEYTGNVNVSGNRLTPGRYRTYFSFDGKLAPTPDDCYIEIKQMPTDRPFVLTSELTTESAEYGNSWFEWMSVTMSYITSPQYKWWFDTPATYQIWASHEDSPEEEFLLYEEADKFISSYSTATATLSGAPAVLWRKPGVYNIYMRYSQDGNLNWITPDDSMNRGSFTLTEYQPTGPHAELAAPMEINGGRIVQPGEYFEVKCRLRSESGIEINPTTIEARISESIWEWSSFGYVESVTVDNPSLAPGGETDMTLRFFLPDFNDFYDKRFAVIIDLPYSDGQYTYSSYVHPREHLESIYFTAGIDSGIDTADVNDSFTCRMDGDMLAIDGIAPNDTIELWRTDGTMVMRETASGTSAEISLGNHARGVYILTIHSSTRCHTPRKILLR